MDNTSSKLSSSPEKKKMKMEGPGGMAATARGSQEVEIKEEQELKEEEGEEKMEKMEEGGGGQEPKEEEGERECSPEDRKEWKAYGDADDEHKNHASAIELVNRKYKPLGRVTSDPSDPDPNPSDPDPESPQGRRRMRHNAESEFFNIRDKPVRDLMRDVTKNQYRNPKDTKKLKPIDLTRKSARYVIAADRLRQETLITLGTGDKIRSEIPLGRIHPWIKKLGLGPEETYEAYVTEQVVSEHRMEISDNEPPLPKLGNSLVRRKYYKYEQIFDFFKRVIGQLGGPATEWRRLADLLIQFAHSHSLAGAPELSDEDRGELFKICFLIMDKNQAMWQGCFFKQGPKGGKGKVWRLGMSVSFARLIILFREGVIPLNDVFFKYGIYSDHGGIIMIRSNEEVNSRCDAIDEKYREHKDRPLTIQDAIDDLGIVYGGVGSPQEKRYEADREYFHNSSLRVDVEDNPSIESMSRFKFASLQANLSESEPLPDVGSYKADLEKIMKALGGGTEGQRRLAELFIKFRPSHSISEAEASGLDMQQKERLAEIFTAMWRVHWLWQWGSYESKLWPLGLTVSFARLVLLFKKGEITLDYVFEACGIGSKHDSVASVRDKCDEIDKQYADIINGRGITKLTKLDAINDLRKVYGEDVKWNYPEMPRLPTRHNKRVLKIEKALEDLPAGPPNREGDAEAP